LVSIDVIETYENKSINSNNHTENTGGESPPAAEKNGGGSPSGGGNNGGGSPDVYTDKQYVAFERKFLRELTQSNMEELDKYFPVFCNLNHNVRNLRNYQNGLYCVLYQMEKVKNKGGNEGLKNEITRQVYELLQDNLKRKKILLESRYMEYQHIQNVCQGFKQTNGIANPWNNKIF
jgi:hypothetical protein